MAGTPPDYSNIRWGGPKGGLIPQEIFPATFLMKKETDINVGGAGTTNSITLDPSQTSSSYYTVTNAGSGATTIIWPGLFQGAFFVVYNNSGQNVTFKVVGKTGITVATGKKAILVMDLVAGDIQRVTADT